MTHLFFKMLKDKMLYDTGTRFGYMNVRDQVNKKKKLSKLFMKNLNCISTVLQ